MTSVFGLISRVRTIFNPPEAKPDANTKPLKFGILGAANIAPDALIKPVKSHPEAVVFGVAARNKEKAAAYAKTHGIKKVYNSYEELLADPEIDCIYNPLPNGLHYEWTMKALAAGKHVLLEKPAANTAEETRAMFDLAEQKNLVLLEAFHYRFHPVAHRVREIIESGELGPVKGTDTHLTLSGGYFSADDIRFNYSLGGGALMDMGCYTINSMRFFGGEEPSSVSSVSHQLVTKASGKNSELVDRRTEATFTFAGGMRSSIVCDLATPARFGLIPKLPDFSAKIRCEQGEIRIMNYLMPSVYHSITVVPIKGKQRVEKVYTFPNLGQPWWSTYRYQLEAFVNKVRGRPVHTWVTKEDSIANMEVIESVYAKGGLGSRPKSEWMPPNL
ncbi:hypothetical protein MIND_00369800 [Mycena indigotica]|uniref:D-xylose 1-dehydrogenase (NADP(+), D-xylono-1,5-lactone-forming) n=1 Tax=Mycena indigotica TaxID=2126181 RepID=A0A8H6T5V3_9AGAR|nr:uncharacterized protein MIND_00369800 [Mycena indigotica]KAF7309970.1 hypothetical protein MIND_00369800 [Mycena indigotica]